MKDPMRLKAVQDQVWADPQWKSDGITTHCNQAALAVANGLGCHEFDAPTGGESYTADQLWYFFQRKNRDGGPPFLEQDLANSQDLANAGSLVFAICPSWLLGESHGHIVSITPGDPVMSESLGKKVPVCLNISTAALSSRSVGLNWAFPLKRVMPQFFAWRESL